MAANRKSAFSSDELALLQRAFDLACADLRLEADGLGLREQLGALIFDIAAAGEGDWMVLRRESVRRFHRGSVGPSSEADAGVLPLFRGRKGNPRHLPRKG